MQFSVSLCLRASVLKLVRPPNPLSLRSLRLCVRYFSPPLGAGNHAEAAHSKVPEEQCTLARSGAESLARVRVRPRAVDIYSWNSRTVGQLARTYCPTVPLHTNTPTVTLLSNCTRTHKQTNCTPTVQLCVPPVGQLEMSVGVWMRVVDSWRTTKQTTNEKKRQEKGSET